MKWQEFPINPNVLAEKKLELLSVINIPTTLRKRPCPSCSLPCSTHGSTQCCCNCSEKCENLASQLSTEPDRYPVEEKIIPLVYHLNSTEMAETFWSCEGHTDSQGQVVKLPKIFFYTYSKIIPGLITEVVLDLTIKKKIRYDWQVVFKSFNKNMDYIFSLEPYKTHKEFQLHLLHNDIIEIARGLKPTLQLKARDWLKVLERKLAESKV